MRMLLIANHNSFQNFGPGLAFYILWVSAGSSHIAGSQDQTQRADQRGRRASLPRGPSVLARRGETKQSLASLSEMSWVSSWGHFSLSLFDSVGKTPDFTAESQVLDVCQCI